MKSKLNYLIDMSLKRKIKTKWFLIANILLCFALVGLTNIESVIKLFGGDFDEKQKIVIVDKTNTSYDIFTNQIKMSENLKKGDKSKYIFEKSNEDIKTIKKNINKNKKTMALIFEPDLEKVLKVTLISQEYIDVFDTQVLDNAIYNTKVMLAIEKSNISLESINNIYEKVNINRVILDDSKKSKDETMESIMSTVFPIIILPFFMLILFLVQMIGGEVNDEKTTRGMEIIISNVSPKTHFFSKIIAGNLFILIQTLLLFVFSGLGLFVKVLLGGKGINSGMFESVKDIISKTLTTEFASKLIYILPLVLILMLLTFLAYSLLAGILASMTTNSEDFQQLQTPLMIILLVGYYLAIMAGMFKGSLFITILSFVPLISAILSPSLLIIGQIGIIEVIISIVIMILTNWLLIKYGLKIYKAGILNYSSTKLWKKMAKAVKE